MPLLSSPKPSFNPSPLTVITLPTPPQLSKRAIGLQRRFRWSQGGCSRTRTTQGTAIMMRIARTRRRIQREIGSMWIPRMKRLVRTGPKVDSFVGEAHEIPGAHRNDFEEFGTWRTVMLVFQTHGVVFGDVGASPFDIRSTKDVPVRRLRRWRQAALVLDASRWFRDEENSQLIDASRVASAAG